MKPSRAQLYRKRMPGHVCPYGLKARHLLLREGFDLDDHPLTSAAEVEAFQQDHGVRTTPQVFIDGERIGGHDALRVHLGLDDPDSNGTTYLPVILLFALALLMTVAVRWNAAVPLLSVDSLSVFVGTSMCLLALQKLRDLEAFSLQFLNYDLLAQRWVPYASLYPFAEALAGVGMLAGVWPPLYALPALFIGTVGAVSVFKAVYIDRRELKCACVGGNSRVPLGFVSLTENLMMVAMPAWMLATL